MFLRQIRRRQRTTGSSSSSSSSDGSAGSHFLAGGKAGSVGSLAYFAFNFHGRNAQVTGDCLLFISFSLVCFLIFFSFSISFFITMIGSFVLFGSSIRRDSSLSDFREGNSR